MVEVSDFLSAKVWAVVKREMTKNTYFLPGKILETVKDCLTFKEARDLKRKLNDERQPIERDLFYFQMVKMEETNKKEGEKS